MRAVVRAVSVILFAMVLAPGEGTSQASDDASEAATAAVHEFLRAWNTGDNAELRRTMHFPFVTMVRGNVFVAQTAEDFSTDYDGMRASEDWSRSAADRVRVVRSTSTEVFLELDYSRYNSSGERYFSGTVMYIATKRDERWRLQFRMPMGAAPSG